MKSISPSITKLAIAFFGLAIGFIGVSAMLTG
jgi:hypothetical protein